MDLASFIAQYGYIAIVLGAIIEGETVAVLGGIAANTTLSLPMVYFMAFIGAWLCDSVLFLVGHYYGPAIIEKLPKHKDKIDLSPISSILQVNLLKKLNMIALSRNASE